MNLIVICADTLRYDVVCHTYPVAVATPAWCRDESHVYFARNDGRDARLFDLCTDPEQQKNVASERPSVVQMMFERILSDAGGPLPDYRHLREQAAVEWWELYRFR